jgi:hypothetical protein
MADVIKQVFSVAEAKRQAKMYQSAAKAMADHCDMRVAKYEKLCCLLVEALSMYADPGFYHAITIIGDRPTGGFDEDVSRVQGSDYNRPMPGKLARQALRNAEKFVARNPQAFGSGAPNSLPLLPNDRTK